MSIGVHFLAFLVLLAADPTAAHRTEHLAEIEAWRAKREASLTAEGGWLSLVGLAWLERPRSRFGSDRSNEIVLPNPTAPARAGTFVRSGEDVEVAMAPGVAATLNGQPVTKARLRSDKGGGTPDLLVLGSLTLQVIDRGGRLAIRIKDRESPARRGFKGLSYYPLRSDYRVEARFVAHPAPVSITVPSAAGGSESLPSPGYVTFELSGKRLRLDPVSEPGSDGLFFIFRDATTGRTTYGGGRFLHSDAPKTVDGEKRVVLDFNKAYSPPCAFTAYATCPLPPKQNRLPIAIEAGEMKPH